MAAINRKENKLIEEFLKPELLKKILKQANESSTDTSAMQLFPGVKNRVNMTDVSLYVKVDHEQTVQGIS